MNIFRVYAIVILALLGTLAATMSAPPQRKSAKPPTDFQASLQKQVDRWNAGARKAGISLVLHRESSGALGVGLENRTEKALRLYPIVFQDTLTLRFYDSKGREVPLGAKIASPHIGGEKTSTSVDGGETMEEAVPMSVVKRRLTGPEKASYVMARYQGRSGSNANGEPYDLGGIVVWSNVLKLP